MLVTVDEPYKLGLGCVCTVCCDMKRLFIPRSNGNIIAVTEQLDLCHLLFLVIGLTLTVLIQQRYLT
jgi:hypothetical protein